MPAGGRDPRDSLRNANLFSFTNGTQSFTLELTENGGIFRFSEPEILKPLVVTLEGETVKAAYDGLETETDVSFLASVFPVYEALRAFRTAETVRWADENILSLDLDGKTFLLYYDSDGGVITRLEVKGADGSMSFDLLSCMIKDDNAESSRTD